MKSLSDITAPMTVTRKLLEADVQDACVKWARARSYWARKFSSQSQRSVPDYLFATLHEGKLKFACEFKRPGCPLKWSEKHQANAMSTEAQLDEQAAMRLAGWFVFECDNFENFKAIVIAYEKEQA